MGTASSPDAREDGNGNKLSQGQLNPAFVSNDEGSEFPKKNNNSSSGDLSTEQFPHRLKYEATENRRIIKNVVVTSIAFMCLFTAFQSMAALQSSLNNDPSQNGLGTYALSTVYGGLILSSFFLPTLIISKLTVKWTLFFAMIGYVIYISGQFYPRYYTLVPAAVITGMCAAQLWSAKCTYLTLIGHEYAALVKDDSEVVIVKFFGIFFFFFQSASVIGNLISSLILSTGNTKDPNSPEECGANYCPSLTLNSTASEDDGKTKVYTLAGVFLGFSLLAMCIVYFFMDPLSRYGEKKREGSAKKLLLATAKQWVEPYQLLIIPLTIWSGLEQGFLGSDFTAGYITCAWGVGNVGYVLICYGVCDAISSISFGPVIRRYGRMPVFIFGALVNLGVTIALIKWIPNPDEKYLFFIFAGLWGIADGIWQCEINAFYGILFPSNEEAAFANYRLWESLGFIIAYVNTSLVCTSVKLYLLIAVLALGMAGYFVIEYKERKKSK